MTLQKLINEIAIRAIKQKIVNSSGAGSDVYLLNGMTIKDYPILYTSPTGSHSVTKNTTEFSITLYYLDRLLNDSSNELDVLSTAVEELKNIVLNIEKIPGVVGVSDEYQITNFTETEAMNDRVAGAYTQLMVEVKNETICPEE